MNAKQIIKQIEQYIHHRYGNKSDREAPIVARWSEDGASYYIYNNSKGRPVCLAMLRVSDHGPTIAHYTNTNTTDFRFPSNMNRTNVSIEFYNPNRRFDNVPYAPAPYTFPVNRFCYKAVELTKEDVNKIIVNMILYVEQPSKGYVDPFKGTSKEAFFKPGRGYKSPKMKLRIPKKYITMFKDRLNILAVAEPGDVIIEESDKSFINPYNPDNRLHEYMFITYDDTLDIQAIAEDIITIERDKSEIYESVMKTFYTMVSKMFD